MNWSMVAAGLWVMVASITALLSMRLQLLPGIVLLATAPAILIWIGLANGILWSALAMAGFVSMFRKPLIYFVRKAVGMQLGAGARISGREDKP